MSRPVTSPWSPPRTRTPLASAQRVLALTVGLAAALAGARAQATELGLPIAETEGDIALRAERGQGELAAETAARASQTLREIGKDLRRLDYDPRVEIRLVERAEDLQSVVPADRNIPTGARAAAFPREGILALAAQKSGATADVQDVADRELARLVLERALGGRAPAWLAEGFGHLHAEAAPSSRLRTLVGMAWSSDPIALGALSAKLAEGGDEAARAQVQAYDFVRYLAERGRAPGTQGHADRGPFRDFLARLGEGESTGEAAESAYRASLRSLYGEWRETLRDRYLVAPGSFLSAGIWVLASLLLCAAFVRRRGQKRAAFARWEREESAHRDERAPSAEGRRAAEFPTARVRSSPPPRDDTT